jgi:hypothetical protein
MRSLPHLLLGLAVLGCASSTSRLSQSYPTRAGAAVAGILRAGRQNGVQSAAGTMLLCGEEPSKASAPDSVVLRRRFRTALSIRLEDCYTEPALPDSGLVLLMVWEPSEPASGSWWGQEYPTWVTELRGPNSCAPGRRPENPWPYFIDCRKGYRQQWMVIVADSEHTFVTRDVSPSIN